MSATLTPSADTCALCGDDDAAVLVIRDERRVYLSACALCLIRAFDQLTGYKFEKMMMQYDRLKQYHAAVKEQRKNGKTTPPKGSRYADILSDTTAS